MSVAVITNGNFHKTLILGKNGNFLNLSDGGRGLLRNLGCSSNQLKYIINKQSRKRLVEF